VVAIDLEGDQRTRIEAGKLADLIVVRENPLDDIDNVRALAMVFKGWSAGGRPPWRCRLPLEHR
jgi:hypothetical protein